MLLQRSSFRVFYVSLISLCKIIFEACFRRRCLFVFLLIAARCRYRGSSFVDVVVDIVFVIVVAFRRLFPILPLFAPRDVKATAANERHYFCLFFALLLLLFLLLLLLLLLFSPSRYHPTGARIKLTRLLFLFSQF